VENQKLADEYFVIHGITASIKEAVDSFQTGNYEKDKCTQLRGEDCNKLIVGHKDFLQFVHCEETTVHTMWTLWNTIVFNIIEVDSEKLKTFDYEQAQILIDIFARTAFSCFPHLGIPDYMHYLQAHFLDIQKKHGPLIQLSNQGCEHFHQLNLRIYENLSLKGGKESKPDKDLISYHYVVFCLRNSP
jgi:hypothetical protein